MAQPTAYPLQFGAFITPANRDPAAVIELALEAERGGLDLVSFQDHPYQPGYLDTWTLLSFVAARTERVKLAPNVLNLPLRQPAVLARSAASLDLLSGGRVELGVGAGAFWDAIESMGAERLTAGESVTALAEAIRVIRAIWDGDAPGKASVAGEYHRLRGAARGPKPAHPIQLWLGAYKPRMLRLTGREADGWLPSLAYLEPGRLAEGNRIIDEAAAGAGRDPAQIRRLLNINGSFGTGGEGPLEGPPGKWAETLARFALEDSVSCFIVMGDEPLTLRTFAEEVVPLVRELTAVAEPSGGNPPAGPGPQLSGGERPTATQPASGEPAPGEYGRLGVTPTPDHGSRFAQRSLLDEQSRPRRAESGPEVTYTERGRLAGQHLIDVHDHLRTELEELREVIARVREGALSAGEARGSLNEMAMRQNDWTLGAFCSRYCRAVAQHHGLEDAAVFPHLARSDQSLGPVIDRLTEEHHVIHEALESVDRALVAHINDPADFDVLQRAVDELSDALLSHLSYEERELVEPLARVGFGPGQV